MAFTCSLTSALRGTFSGVLSASEADELREKAKAPRKVASTLAEKGNKEAAERLEKESLKLLEDAERMELKGKERGEKTRQEY